MFHERDHSFRLQKQTDRFHWTWIMEMICPLRYYFKSMPLFSTILSISTGNDLILVELLWLRSFGSLTFKECRPMDSWMWRLRVCHLWILSFKWHWTAPMRSETWVLNQSHLLQTSPWTFHFRYSPVRSFEQTTAARSSWVLPLQMSFKLKQLTSQPKQPYSTVVWSLMLGSQIASPNNNPFIVGVSAESCQILCPNTSSPFCLLMNVSLLLRM